MVPMRNLEQAAVELAIKSAALNGRDPSSDKRTKPVLKDLPNNGDEGEDLWVQHQGPALNRKWKKVAAQQDASATGNTAPQSKKPPPPTKAQLEQAHLDAELDAIPNFDDSKVLNAESRKMKRLVSLFMQEDRLWTKKKQSKFLTSVEKYRNLLQLKIWHEQLYQTDQKKQRKVFQAKRQAGELDDSDMDKLGSQDIKEIEDIRRLISNTEDLTALKNLRNEVSTIVECAAEVVDERLQELHEQPHRDQCQEIKMDLEGASFTKSTNEAILKLVKDKINLLRTEKEEVEEEQAAQAAESAATDHTARPTKKAKGA